MGGHASGEVASKMAVDTVAEHFRNTAEDAELTWPYKLDGPDKYDANRLINGIKLANLRIYEKAQQDENCHGMGTTIVATLFLDDKVLIGHVGDRRVYRLRDGQLMQLTEDHSLLNDYIQMKRLAADDVGNFPHKNVIVRALGMKESVQVDLVERSDARQRHVPSVQRRAVGHGRRSGACVHSTRRAGPRYRVRAADPRRQSQRRQRQHHLRAGSSRTAVEFAYERQEEAAARGRDPRRRAVGFASVESEVGDAYPAGDFLGFPTGTAHHTRNPFDEELVYLVGGEHREYEVGDFPRLGRRMVRRGDQIDIFKISDAKPFGPLED